MIFIRKGQANTVVVTLTEKATTTTYDVLFKFVSETTGRTYLFTCDDESNVTRYNKFTITDTAHQNVYQGKVNFEEDQYKYTIYEMPTASPKSLDPDDATGTLETGRVTVFRDVTNNEFDANEDKNTPQFE